MEPDLGDPGTGLLPFRGDALRISVIIPALNEADNISRAVFSAKGAFEIIVADGGSQDRTVEAAEGLACAVINTQKGRGRQMDAGAAIASGEVLLFLHADTVLPHGWKKAIEDALREAGTIAGAFRLSIDSAGFKWRLIERGADIRAKTLGLIYGDQAIFIRKEAFFKAGGFSIPLMEDVDCVRRLRGRGRVVLLEKRVLTSPRRWKRSGAACSTVRNMILLSLYFLGVSPDRLYSFYYKKN